MDDPILAFIKDFLWAPLLALIAWAWTRNEKEHSMLWKKVEKTESTFSSTASHLNDKLLEHIDTQVRETREFVINEDNKIVAEVTRQRDVSAKIFDKIEEQGKKSENRHVETLTAIHNLAMAMHENLSKKVDK